MKLRNPLTLIKKAYSNIQRMHDFSYKVPNEQEMSFGTKNVLRTQQHQPAKSMKTEKISLYKYLQR